MIATAFTFDQLSEKAQAHAIDKARYTDVEYGDWRDAVYEDAARMAALLDIDIDTHDTKRAGPKIYFSGFYSQGDGACFVGWYRPSKDIASAIKAECNDEVLIGIAERLTVLNVGLALTPGFERLQTKITASGSYCHSGTMQFETEWEPHGIDSFDDFPVVSSEEKIASCLRDFADWIYRQLEAEHDHLTSDEHVRERLKDDGAVFDEDGDMI